MTRKVAIGVGSGMSTTTGRVVVRASLGILAIEAAWVAFVLVGGDPRFQVATDFHIYRDAAARWLEGGGFYLPEQLNGPYQLRIGSVLYPPVILWLLVPFVFLPALLWWLTPLALTAYAIWKLRPSTWGWPLLVALCLWPRTPQIVIHGNPTLWVIAFATLAILYSWPGPFVLIKPILAPFALIGVRRRAWWVGLAAFLILCMPFGTVWLDWIQLTVDSGGATYAFGDYVPMLIPVVAWAARSSSGSAAWPRSKRQPAQAESRAPSRRHNAS